MPCLETRMSGLGLQNTILMLAIIKKDDPRSHGCALYYAHSSVYMCVGEWREGGGEGGRGKRSSPPPLNFESLNESKKFQACVESGRLPVRKEFLLGEHLQYQGGGWARQRCCQCVTACTPRVLMVHDYLNPNVSAPP